jgi:hypothetical protein
MTNEPQSIMPDSSPNPPPSALLLKHTILFIKYYYAFELINDGANRKEIDWERGNMQNR